MGWWPVLQQGQMIRKTLDPGSSYCHALQLDTGFGLVIGFIDHLKIVNTYNHTTPAN
jgi:hypothetical protein